MLTGIKAIWSLVEKFPMILVAIILVLCATFTFPLFSTIGGWLGFETKASLKKENTVLIANNAVLTEANAKNTVAVAIAKDDVKITSEVIDKVDEGKKTVDRTIKTIAKTTEDKIKVIDASSATEEEKVLAKSTERALGIWRTYCSFNQNPDCAVVLKEAPDPVDTPEEKHDVAQYEPDVPDQPDDRPDRLWSDNTSSEGNGIRSYASA